MALIKKPDTNLRDHQPIKEFRVLLRDLRVGNIINEKLKKSETS